MAYTSVTGVPPPFRDDDSQFLLYKIAWALWGVANGDLGFTVNTVPAQTSSAPSNSAILTPATGSTIETLAAGERLFVQNLDVTPLFVKRGAAASPTDFHYGLSACGAQDDCTGGSLWIEDHIGVVSIAGTTPRFMAWKVAS